ncbi:hypothetical protein GTS_28670 [Gandjariella thermophila]|uniref:Uncharacterized protein n=1 Tax=Gandjariella thermophila TaxID=1931992 RepID=A0A4D4J6W0_9PSEU|nr:hypothetical protein GTS_28670 [Gandjariella thermophila]
MTRTVPRVTGASACFAAAGVRTGAEPLPESWQPTAERPPGAGEHAVDLGSRTGLAWLPWRVPQHRGCIMFPLR